MGREEQEKTHQPLLSGRTVMVIDKDPACAEVFVQVLSNEEATIVGGGDQEANLASLQADIPEALVIDWETILAHPDFWEKVKPVLEEKHIPWILTSCFSERELAQEAQKQGARSFLPKPLTEGDFLGELIRQVTEAIELTPADSQTGRPPSSVPPHPEPE